MVYAYLCCSSGIVDRITLSQQQCVCTCRTSCMLYLGVIYPCVCLPRVLPTCFACDSIPSQLGWLGSKARSRTSKQTNTAMTTDNHASQQRKRSTGSESGDLERPLSVSLPSLSPIREHVPRDRKRVRKTHQVQRISPQSSTPHQIGEEQSARPNRASSSKMHGSPEAQKHNADDRLIELTHTYKIRKDVYRAFMRAAHAGHRFDHYLATWGLSQLHPATALRILSSLPNTMRTKAQQYVDYCVEDVLLAQSTRQHGDPQHHRQQTRDGNSYRRLHRTTGADRLATRTDPGWQLGQPAPQS